MNKIRYSLLCTLCFISILGMQALFAQEIDSELSPQIPTSKLLIAGGEWSYSPVNTIRQRSVTLLFLRSDGKVLQLLGNLIEGTTQIPPMPGISMTNLFKLDVGTWKQNHSTITLSLKCLGSMYVIGANGKDPCAESQRILTVSGYHLFDNSEGFEPAIGTYPEAYKILQRQFFEEACHNQQVSSVFSECLLKKMRKGPG